MGRRVGGAHPGQSVQVGNTSGRKRAVQRFLRAGSCAARESRQVLVMAGKGLRRVTDVRQYSAIAIEIIDRGWSSSVGADVSAADWASLHAGGLEAPALGAPNYASR